MIQQSKFFSRTSLRLAPVTGLSPRSCLNMLHHRDVITPAMSAALFSPDLRRAVGLESLNFLITSEILLPAALRLLSELFSKLQVAYNDSGVTPIQPLRR